MSIRYKPDVDIIAMLKAAGYTTYRLRQEHLISESALTKMRAHTLPSWKELDILCRLLNCQPGDIIEHAEPDPEPETPAEPAEADPVATEPPKRKRGRPKKHTAAQVTQQQEEAAPAAQAAEPVTPKKKRGRPRKNPE